MVKMVTLTSLCACIISLANHTPINAALISLAAASMAPQTGRGNGPPLSARLAHRLKAALRRSKPQPLWHTLDSGLLLEPVRLAGCVCTHSASQNAGPAAVRHE